MLLPIGVKNIAFSEFASLGTKLCGIRAWLTPNAGTTASSTALHRVRQELDRSLTPQSLHVTESQIRYQLRFFSSVGRSRCLASLLRLAFAVGTGAASVHHASAMGDIYDSDLFPPLVCSEIPDPNCALSPSSAWQVRARD